MHTSTVTWSDDMAFEAALDGFTFHIDASPDHGGKERGPRPKTLVLTALAGCTAMDVISIVRKMRLEPELFAVDASSEQSDEHPRVFTGILLKYRFEGDLPVPRLRRAIELSLGKYCGVTAMIEPAVPISWELWLGGELVAEDRLGA